MRTRQIKENTAGYLFILPALVGFGLFMVYPLIYSIFLSFMDWNMFKGLGGSSFVGVKNYLDALENDYFRASLINNLKVLVLAIPLLITLSLLIAYFLNKNILGRGMMRTIYFLPYITTITAAAIVFSALFNGEYGPVNGFLRALGIADPPQWITSSKWALPTVSFFWTWRELGYCIIIFLAGLQSINNSYYEAAEIDGANGYYRFTRITLPLISPTTFFLIVTSIIKSFQIFPEVKVMTTNGGPGTATHTMVFHIYREAFEFYKLGYSSAVAFIFLLIILAITGLQWIGQKKWVNY